MEGVGVADIKNDQHFVTDPDVLARIVELSRPEGDETVLEIGAGKGALTKLLSEAAGRVIAFEKDRSFEPDLEIALKGRKNVEILWGNALDMGWPPFDRLVSNLPYSISEPVVQRLVYCKFRKAVLLVPEHFTRILTGKSQTKLSIVAEAFFSIKPDILVYPSSFSPEPKVNSRILVLEPKEPKDAKAAVFQDFLRQKNKNAKNALREAMISGAARFGGVVTKREARKMAGENLPEKRVYALSMAELVQIQDFIMFLGI
ncbi:MAG: rRNA adenine N-6-methyltransferase family protein [Candidatus Aenigmatarchaeota archaeon]